MCDVGQYCWSSANFCSKNKECSEIVTEAEGKDSTKSINNEACSCIGSQEAQSCSADVNGLWCGRSTGKEGARCAWTRAGLYYKRLTDSWLETGTLDIPVGPLGAKYFVVGSDKKEEYHNIHDAVRKYSKNSVGSPYGPINEWDVSRITDLRCLFSTNGEAFGGTSAGKYSRPKTFVHSFLE